ncbi:MAG: sensor domain-containing diguanylate cyclase [Gemmatimonadaceae bacterium]
MIWLILAFAFVALVSLAAATRHGMRLAARARLSEDAESVDAEPRVRQFLETGTHRLELPRGSVADLRVNAPTVLEEAEVASDFATLDAFLADVRDSVGADEAIFWRWSSSSDSLLPAAWSTPGAAPKFFDKTAWSGFVQWAAEGKVMHFDADARVAVTRLAAAPIEHDGALIGVLSVARAEGLERGREHIKSWLPRHAAQIGRLMSHFELRREYARHMRQSQALLKAAQVVQAHKAPDALIRSICEIALRVSSASDAALIRWRADAGRGWVQFTTPGFRHNPPFPLSADSLTGRTCIAGTLLLIEDVSTMRGENPLFFDGDGGWTKGTLAIVPLKLDERVIGAIVVASDRPASVPRDEAHNLTLLGALAARSLEMVWEIEEVSRRARTDALTGLANRRAFDDQLGTMLAHADRFGHPVSLIMADVDHFKAVNDNWGHEAGDVVLKAIAGTLTDGVRAVDLCCRFGGEEFAILLPQTTLLGAAELADRLRKEVEERPIRTGGAEISVTISCGVACYPEGVLTREALFAGADRALYEAKSAGRNCVKSAIPKPTGIVR